MIYNSLQFLLELVKVGIPSDSFLQYKILETYYADIELLKCFLEKTLIHQFINLRYIGLNEDGRL